MASPRSAEENPIAPGNDTIAGMSLPCSAHSPHWEPNYINFPHRAHPSGFPGHHFLINLKAFKVRDRCLWNKRITLVFTVLFTKSKCQENAWHRTCRSVKIGRIELTAQQRIFEPFLEIFDEDMTAILFHFSLWSRPCFIFKWGREFHSAISQYRSCWILTSGTKGKERTHVHIHTHTHTHTPHPTSATLHSLKLHSSNKYSFPKGA